MGNLVHRDSLKEAGPIYQAERFPEEQDKEFLASRDPMFRPIGLEHGPDGALYLIDMQREVIEHPDYIPAKVLQGLDVRGGENRGRTIRYSNVVRELKPIGQWTGDRLELTVDLAGAAAEGRAGCAVIVQQGATGAVLGAVKMDLNNS